MCDVSEIAELNREVVNIKGNYEEAEGVLDPSEYVIPDTIIGTPEESEFVGKYDYFKISIMNLNEKFYIEVTNDYNKDKLTFNYNDSKDGVVTFDWKNIDEITKFTVKIYASDKTGCRGELYRTYTITTPRINVYHGRAICEGIEEYYLCQKYVNYDEVDYNTFMERTSNYIKSLEEKNKSDEDSWLDKTGNFVSEHKTAFIIGAVGLIIVAGVVVAVIMKKHRSSDEI